MTKEQIEQAAEKYAHDNCAACTAKGDRKILYSCSCRELENAFLTGVEFSEVKTSTASGEAEGKFPRLKEKDLSGWSYDYTFLKKLTEKIIEIDGGEDISMEQTEAVLLSINYPETTPPVQEGEAVEQDELFDELVTKLHNSYNEVELALLKTQYKIIRK